MRFGKNDGNRVWSRDGKSAATEQTFTERVQPRPDAPVQVVDSPTVAAEYSQSGQHEDPALEDRQDESQEPYQQQGASDDPVYGHP
jgi:hypothetical protein